jgi:hypothetical protein
MHEILPLHYTSGEWLLLVCCVNETGVNSRFTVSKWYNKATENTLSRMIKRTFYFIMCFERFYEILSSNDILTVNKTKWC